MTALQNPAFGIRVFLVSDHRLIVWGMQQLIESRGQHFQVAGSAASCGEALAAPGLSSADVVLIDMDQSPENVVESIPRFLVGRRLKILLLTRSDDYSIHDQAIMAGARGLLKQQTSPEMLLSALDKVHRGEMWLDREATGRIFFEMTRRVATKLPDPEQERIASLTEREIEIVTYIAQNMGSSGKAIAVKLHISESTLRNHLTSIYEKLGVANRHGLLAYAFKNGLSKPTQ